MIGTILGNRYELLEKIGEGGMAKVYKAKCRLLNRFVAVKILKEEYSKDKDFVEKFKREATAAASLSDNNIVDIYDIGSEKDINYIVLEYVNGKTLKQIIRENGKLDYKIAVSTSIQIAKALDCAHRNNIIHRDIKPHNILVTEDGLVKVTDFGIAKASSSVTITNSSKIMGSAHYFSPEQAKGSYVDFRTDIYSLGIVIYEMVTGRVPYDAESPVSVALKHIQEPVVPPKQLNDNIPDSLNKLILKAIEKEPIKRYQNIKEMLSDLKKIENDEDINIISENFDDDNTRIMAPVRIDKNKKKSSYANHNFRNEKDSNDEYEDKMITKNEQKPKNKKKITAIVLAIIMVILLGGLSGYFIMSKLNNSGSIVTGNDTTIPSIIGLKQDDAKKLVEEKNLKFVVIRMDKSEKTEGTILNCYPEEGTKVKVNSEVRVTVSGGPKKSTIPDLRGIDIGQAKDIIKSGGLELEKIDYKFDDNVPQNQVIRQTPEPEADASINNKITLVVSKGPQIKTTIVPELKGKKIEQAEAILINSSLKIGVKTEIVTDNKEQDGLIINQSIDSGSKVKENTSINISYYRYKEPDPASQASKENEQQVGEQSETKDKNQSSDKNDTTTNNTNNTKNDTNTTNNANTDNSNNKNDSSTSENSKSQNTTDQKQETKH